MTTPDDSLDAQLRGTPVPADLAARVKSALVPSDEQLDVRLCEVPVPSSLAARLHEIPADVVLDESIAAVVVPASLLAKLRLIGRSRRGSRIIRTAATLARAAIWLLAIGLTIGGGAGFLVGTLSPESQRDLQVAALFDGSLFSSIFDEPHMPLPATIVINVPDDIELPAMPLATSTQPISLPLKIEEPIFAERTPRGPVSEWTSLVSSGLRPMDDIVLLRWGVLGSPQGADERLPNLEPARLPAAAGIQPPLVRGYDRVFFLKNRVFPPISPAAHRQLQSLSVPLTFDSDSLSHYERALAEGARPAAAELRVEEFIAAMDYRFAPAPVGRVAIRTTAGPSIFGPQGTGLLQVGVQAGALAPRSGGGTHLVVALDLSHSMTRGGRLEIVHRGIEQLLAQLGDRDRFSLVVFQEEVIHTIELASRADVPAVIEQLRDLAPRGGTNVAAGLSQAASLAMAGPGKEQRRLVLITDSHAQLARETRQSLEELLAAAYAEGVRLDVVDLSEQSAADEVLTEMASSTGGRSTIVRSARQMYWSLAESLVGSAPVVADDARLTLHFNPEAVAAYRLIGHEANGLADIQPVSVAADIAAGESASALVEIWFQPGENDDLGYAELVWKDATGRQQRQRQRISRLQFAPTFAESSLPLQQAAIVAEIAEQLRGSAAALREAGLVRANTRGLSGVLAKSREASPRVRERADLQRLLSIVRKLEGESQ